MVTVEDGIRNGGAGNFIADAIADLNANRQSPPVLNLGVPTAYIPHGKPDRILGQLGLDGPGIAASIFKAIEWGAKPSDIASEEGAPVAGVSAAVGAGEGEHSGRGEVDSDGNGADDGAAHEDLASGTPLPAGR